MIALRVGSILSGVLDMDRVRFGVIGAAGSIAGLHQGYFPDIKGLDYVAACDISEDIVGPVAEKHGVEAWTDAEAMIRSGTIDAVLIACPHYDHPKYCRIAFDAGVNVLVEKPVAVTALEAEKTDALFVEATKKHPKLLYAGMFNQRTNPAWKVIKRLCSDGSLGELMRVSWTISSWFRSQTYYNSGGWRATWAGEGGGVLINQCPHNLDLLCWFVGSPSRVTANVSLGKYHDIEVEDDVTAILEFPNGATGTFVTTTGQAPGINRLEIVGTHGTVISDGHRGDSVTFYRAGQSVPEFCATTDQKFGDPPFEVSQITPASEKGPEHSRITRNFVETILAGGTQSDLIAPGTEGITGLELGNAMLMSGLKKEPVNIPTDRDAFAALLEELKAKSTFKKPEVKGGETADMASSFNT